MIKLRPAPETTDMMNRTSVVASLSLLGSGLTTAYNVLFLKKSKRQSIFYICGHKGNIAESRMVRGDIRDQK